MKSVTALEAKTRFGEVLEAAQRTLAAGKKYWSPLRGLRHGNLFREAADLNGA